MRAVSAWRTGAWRVLGPPELFAEARLLLEESSGAERSARGPGQLGPFAIFFKGSPLATRPALRHALRRAAGLEIPRLQEFANLEWLRAHGFQAARALLAGVRTEGLLPRYQFLFTELRPAEPALNEWFPSAPGEQRAELLTALAHDLARMHRLGFVHRDLYPRNLVVALLRSGPRCVFLDAWRGGPGPGLRGPDHDLGCLFLDGARLFTPVEQSLFLTRYREASARLGRALPQNWPARVEGARSAVSKREARRRPGLAPTWRFPPLG